MFYKVKKSTKPKEPSEFGRLYVFRIVLRNSLALWKVGITSSEDRYEDRFFEVLRGFFTQYRYVPEAKICKAVKTRVPRLLERHMHELLAEYSYTFDKKFGGSTEFFKDLDEEVLLDYITNFDYNILLKGKREIPTKDYEAIRKHLHPEEEGTDELPF